MIIERHLKETPHIVAFLDLLGASEKMWGPESQATLDQIAGLFEQAKEEWPRESGDLLDIQSAIFSDNILFARPMPGLDPEAGITEAQWDRMAQFLAYVAKFQAAAMEHSLLFRGGVTYGSLYINSYRNIVWGRGLAVAHALERQVAIYPRVVLGDEFRAMPPQPFIRQGDDGLLFIDYLALAGQDKGLLAENARRLIHQEMAKRGTTTREKIMQKYYWLDNYVQQSEK